MYPSLVIILVNQNRSMIESIGFSAALGSNRIVDLESGEVESAAFGNLVVSSSAVQASVVGTSPRDISATVNGNPAAEKTSFQASPISRP